MNFDRKNLTDDQLLHLYQELLLPRLIEEKMLILLRQNKISKWFSGIGQEAISVASGLILQDHEYIFPMHRNLGVFTTRKVPLEKLFAQFQGKMEGYTKGRDRSFHFGSKEHKIVGMISHLGPQLSLADGVALAKKLKTENAVTVVFTGDGGTSQGEFHEAVNVAAVWGLPVMFIVENNGYGLSTPSSEQFKFKSFVDKGIGYGIKSVSIDGNNLLEAYNTLTEIANEIRKNPEPILIEANTFRMRGHEEASGTKYVPKELMEHWGKKDPIENYENYLLKLGILKPELVKETRESLKKQINKAVTVAFAAPDIVPDSKVELEDIYAPFHQLVVPDTSSSTKSNKRFVDAVSDGLRESMNKYPNLILMGQDIAEYGGVFKITEGFVESFGKDRVRNTPLCESAIIGVALGLSIAGMKSVVEMQFADFVTCGFNQIVNNLAKSHYRWSQNADVVVRMPTGAGVAAGPFHSQSNEAWFFHTPGLKIVYPSNPIDAKGLLNAAIEDPNPYLYFEHKALYRAISAEVPNDYYTTEIGKAAIVKSGTEITVVTYGMGVHWAVSAAARYENKVEVIDLRTLLPWDKETVTASIRKTGKVIVLHEDCLTGGIGGEIAAWISEYCFELLDAPVMREGSLDTPVPFVSVLEQNFLPARRFEEKLDKLLRY